MTPFASAAVHLLVRAGAFATDTVWVQAPGTPVGWFDRALGVASGVMSVTIVIIAIALVPAAWNFRKTYKKTSDMLDRVRADVAPIIKHAHSIADNVDYVSTAIRGDVERIHETLVAANLQLRDAVELTERRMHDFSALLAVVQQEAEGIFVTTAATVRGVRMGASHFAGDDGPELASVEVDDVGLEADVDDEETDNGNDSDTLDRPHAGNDDTDDDAYASPAPRIIRRARTRR